MQPAGAEERTNGTLYAMEVSLRTVAQIKRQAGRKADEESKCSREESSSSDSNDDDNGPPRRFIDGTKPGEPPPGERTKKSTTPTRV